MIFGVTVYNGSCTRFIVAMDANQAHLEITSQRLGSERLRAIHKTSPL